MLSERLTNFRKRAPRAEELSLESLNFVSIKYFPLMTAPELGVVSPHKP